MFSLPSSRQSLLAAAVLLLFVVSYKLLNPGPHTASRALIAHTLSSHIQHAVPLNSTHFKPYLLPVRNASQAHLIPPREYYWNDKSGFQHHLANDRLLSPLFQCTSRPNPFTQHIRLPNLVFNVSQSPPNAPFDPVQKFNPTIIALPHWSSNHYLLVSRVVTEGLHQESLLCEANICHAPIHNATTYDATLCTPSDLTNLGWAGGLRCSTPPIIVNIPPTPAERCTGTWAAFPNIPGFHDPRIFWSGKGEPLIMVNSASRYACVGLWIVDLRTLYEPLNKLLQGRGGRGGPLMSYSHLTELTRNPRSARREVEKNWMLFFPSREEAYVHYDMLAHPQDTGGGGRAFAKLIGNGFTTENLADPIEESCFDQEAVDGRGKVGYWHQGSNALKLLLCRRDEAKKGECGEEEEGRAVHFAVMHRKFSNEWELPLRYERYFVIWEGKAPFRVLAKSRFPVLFQNETVSGWSAEQNRDNATGFRRHDQQHGHNGTFTGESFLESWNTTEEADSDEQHRGDWAYFTYTPSIAWAWRPKSAEIRRENRDAGPTEGGNLHSLNVGYLDDEVVVGIGLEDTAQAFAKAKAETLLQCMEACPVRRDTRQSGGNVTVNRQVKVDNDP